MNLSRRWGVIALAAVLVMSAAVLAEEAGERTKGQKLYNEGNYKDAYEVFRALALEKSTDAKQVGNDLNMATACLQNLNRADEIDDFREDVIRVHARNWRLLLAAAQNYMNGPSWGYIIAGKYQRGHHRGGGQYANSMERDRVRGLQLLNDALKRAADDPDKREVAGFYLTFANILAQYRGYSQAWRLQYLSDLTVLPDYETGYGYHYYYYGGDKGAPVDAQGNVVYHKTPKGFEDAKSDGERWRWLLMQASELDPGRANECRMIFANFQHSQFGVQTMAYYGRWFSGRYDDEEDGKKNESGTYELHRLGEDETIARLATGIKRFKMPDEFNPVRIYQAVAAAGKSGWGEQALNQLAQIFEDRRQYDKGADYWKRSIAEYGAGDKQWKQKRVEQILGNWGMFEPMTAQAAGKGAAVDFRFRNGTKVTFEAHAIKVKELLDDVKAYIKTLPARLDWEKVDISNIGWRLVEKNQAKYLGDKVANWDLELKPRAMHFDRRVTVSTPLQKAGAYLVKGTMEKGNTSQVVIWVDDTVIVKKPLEHRTYLYVGDAVTGAPVAKANVEFFGYRSRWVKDNNNQVDVLNFAEFTDADGQAMPAQKDVPQDYSWLITVTTADGRFAHLGFSGIWYSRYYDYEYNATKVFGITDRPVYRPKQEMKWKFWVRHAKYDQENTSDFAGQSFLVRIHNPKGEKVFEKTVTADAWGGIDGEYMLPKDATLGQYYVNVMKDPEHGLGGTYFRVEEYKKPEYEVTVEAPKEPVMLGEKITATIQAKYYFGAPVVKAKVKYKVLRSDYSATWYPMGVWDWFYGRGYWWFAYDYAWYPGWSEWGCKRPHWWWWGGRQAPPEVVSENEVAIGADGTVKVEIDTAVAKELHGDTDHRYEITAEVVDESRRTIVGTGSVMVARKPFKVYAWVDRGHYRVGDVVEACFNAQTLDSKPVKGKGRLVLYKVTYGKDGKPAEAAAQEWIGLDTNDEGQARVQVKAHQAGQYRLSYKVTDAKAHEIEGGYVFCITGEGFDGSDYRFNDLELVTDKREYGAGDKAQLMVNTNRVGSTVLLFVRPANGVYLAPKVLRLAGKSATEAVEVTKKDMPNFFVEAVTISAGKFYSEMREIVVPPEKRVLNVAVKPSAVEYKPGAKATVAVKVTELNGEPFAGSLAVTAYDKAVEYISGGSNVPEIKEFFWKWRRHHYPATECTLQRWFYNLVKSGVIPMSFLGTFGYSVANEGSQLLFDNDDAGIGGDVRQQKFKGTGGPAGAEGRSLAGEPAAPGVMMNAMAKGDAQGGERERAAGDKPGEGGAGGSEGTVQPTVRKDFADTAFWAAAIATDKEGNASFEMKMPENLTGWKIRVWGMGHGTKVGEAAVEVVTKKNLLLRLQAPRFFVEKDEVVLSANIHNYLKAKKSVEAVLELDGECLKAIDRPTRTVAVDTNGEQRVDWRVSVVREGEAVVRMKALTDEESDAMEMRFPVYVHGMLKMESWSGVIRPEKESGSVALTVPRERRINESRLEVRYSPTLAGAMVDALPYLAEYPYGCTEQTLNRFLPTVITQKILLDMKLDLKAIEEKRTNLNAQEIGDDKERAKGWKRFDRNPVFDVETVQDMVKESLKKLTAMQCSDGGWGWFSGWGEYSSPHTTAMVVHGLQIAKANDVALVPGVLERGVEWLKRYQAEQVRRMKLPKGDPWYKDHADELDAFAFMVLVDAGVKDAEMLEFLYRDRTKIAVYAKALYGMALWKLGTEKDKLEMVVRNIDQYLVQDPENQTAYLKLPNDNWWWCWYGSEYEAQAYYLKLLSRTDPKGEKAPGMVKYLLNNRKHATYWNSTRDTALCVEAFADYLRATGEHKPDLTIEVLLDGKKHKEVKVTSENLFTFDNKLVLAGDAVETGKHTVELRKKGTGPLYFNAYLTNFTLEDFITKAGLEIKVERKYYKLVKVDKTVKVVGAHGQALDQKVEKYDRKAIANLDTLKSGDLVEIELEIASKNDYEYIVFEDMKAAGFEPVDLRSGYGGRGMGAYMELRDERVCFFVRALARGNHSIAYRMRAEIPGKFSALPTRAYAMYAPELKANSDEIKVKIED